MATKTSEPSSSIYLWLELLARIGNASQSLRWEEVHWISGRDDAEETLAGLATKRWLPAPDESVLARLANWAERERDPELLQGIAAIVQRAAIGDPDFKRCLLRLSSLIAPMCMARGRAVVAVQANAEVDRLVEAGQAVWSPLEEVLGEEHCLPRDLLSHAWWRLSETRDRWRDLMRVMYRLRKAIGGATPADLESSKDPFWQKNGWIAAISVTVEQYFIFEIWVEESGLSEDDVEALKAWVQSLEEESLEEESLEEERPPTARTSSPSPGLAGASSGARRKSRGP